MFQKMFKPAHQALSHVEVHAYARRTPQGRVQLRWAWVDCAVAGVGAGEFTSREACEQDALEYKAMRVRSAFAAGRLYTAQLDAQLKELAA